MKNNVWKRLLLIATLLLALAACGTSSRVTQTPEEVHTAWVQALRANDRQTLMQLAAEGEFSGPTVDGYLTRIQDYLRNGYVAMGIVGGAFQGVDTLALEAAGQGRIGYSLWRFERAQICYATTLTATDDGWKVQSWGQRSNCPPA